MDATRSTPVENGSEPAAQQEATPPQAGDLQGRAVVPATAAASADASALPGNRPIMVLSCAIAAEFRKTWIGNLGKLMPLQSNQKAVESQLLGQISVFEAKVRSAWVGDTPDNPMKSLKVGSTTLKSKEETDAVANLVFDALRAEISEMASEVIIEIGCRKERQLKSEEGRVFLMGLRAKEGTTAAKPIDFVNGRSDEFSSIVVPVKPEFFEVKRFWFEGQKLFVKVSYETIKGLLPKFVAFGDGSTTKESASEFKISLMIDLKDAMMDGDTEIVEETFVIDFSGTPFSATTLGKSLLVTKEEMENEAFVAKEMATKVAVE